MRLRTVLMTWVALLALLSTGCAQQEGGEWTQDELRRIQSLSLGSLAAFIVLNAPFGYLLVSGNEGILLYFANFLLHLLPTTEKVKARPSE